MKIINNMPVCVAHGLRMVISKTDVKCVEMLNGRPHVFMDATLYKCPAKTCNYKVLDGFSNPLFATDLQMKTIKQMIEATEVFFTK